MIKELIVLGALIGTPLLANSEEVTSETTSIETTSEVVEEETSEESDIIIGDEVVDEDTGFSLTDQDKDDIIDGIINGDFTLTDQDKNDIVYGIINSDFIQTLLIYLSSTIGGLVLTLIIALVRSISGNIKSKKQAEKISGEFTEITTDLFNKFLSENLLPALNEFGEALKGNSSAQAKLSQIILLSKQGTYEAQIEAFKLIGETCANDSKTQKLCSAAIAEIRKKVELEEKNKKDKAKKLDEIIGEEDGTQI